MPKPLRVRWSDLLVVLATTTGLMLVATSSEAQLSVEARGGAAFPMGDLADTADPGFGVGLTVGHPLTNRLSLTLDGGVNAFGEEGRFDEFRAFSVAVWHYTAGVRYRLTDATATPWMVALTGGLGASTLDSDGFTVSGVGPPRNPRTGEVATDLEGTYLTTAGGVRVERPVTGALSLFADVRASAAFADEGETAILAVATADEADALGVAISVPVTLGVRVAF